jgi:hypothetical protein
VVPEHPLLAPWYRLVEDGDRLLLEHGRSVVVLEGGAARVLLPALLPLLDGARTLDELAAELGEAARPAIANALELLAANRLLAEGGGPARRSASVEAVAAAYGIDPSVAVGRLAAARVGVVGGSTAAAHVARLLQAAGVGSVGLFGWDEPPEVDLVVAAPAGSEVPLLARVERSRRGAGARVARAPALRRPCDAGRAARRPR